MINPKASSSFSSSYRLPTNCNEIGASRYFFGSSAHKNQPRNPKRALGNKGKQLRVREKKKGGGKARKLTTLPTSPILLVPRHIPLLRPIPQLTLQARRKHNGRIIQKIPLARIAPTTRLIQQRSTPRSSRAEEHVDHLFFGFESVDFQHLAALRTGWGSADAIPVPGVCCAIGVSFASQRPEVWHREGFDARVFGQDEF